MSQPGFVSLTRTHTGKSVNRKLRKQHKIPAILYGPSGTQLLEMEEETTRHFMEKLPGTHQLVPLQVIDAESENTTDYQVLLQEIQKHPYKPELIHVDFWELAPNKPVVLKVPIKRVGSAPAEKKGANLQMVVRKIQISCMPDNIPEWIEVDISQLDVGDNLKVEEIQMPEGVTLYSHQNYTVISVVGRVYES